VPNKLTGANVGGRRQLAVQTCRAARVAQFWRSASLGPSKPHASVS
jgi:hypothetical protein